MGENFNYLSAPGIYCSGTHLDIWISTFCIIAFTVLYSHKQLAYVTSVKVFVNKSCFKKWRSFICATSAPSFDKDNYCDNISVEIRSNSNISIQHLTSFRSVENFSKWKKQTYIFITLCCISFRMKWVKQK